MNRFEQLHEEIEASDELAEALYQLEEHALRHGYEVTFTDLATT